MRKNILLLFAFAAMIFVSCTEDIDTSSRYVFKDHTVVSYLEAHSEDYSEYVDLLKKVKINGRVETSSTLYQLLTARGNYTVFAVTNEAIQNYLNKLVEQGLIEEPDWDAFKVYPDSTKLDSIRSVIVKNSIIDGADLESQRYNMANLTALTNNGEIPLPNLNDKKLTVYTDPGTEDAMYLNGDCSLDTRNNDIEVLNGVIHQLHKVIAPDDQNARKYFQTILDKGVDPEADGYYTYARLFQACGLFDTFSVVRDEVYEDLYQRGQIDDFEDFMKKGFTDQKAKDTDDACVPQHRYVGFTMFLEPDALWRENGIDPASPTLLKDITDWIVSGDRLISYSENKPLKTDEDYSSPDHVLYQWVTYHLLPFRLQANKLVYHENEVGYSYSNPYRYTIPVYEYYATMGQRRIMKLYESSLSGGVRINRFPIRNNSRTGNGHEASCDPDKEGQLVDRESELTIVNDIENANIYPIHEFLNYDRTLRDNLGKERMRFDGMALFPEAMTNEVRRRDSEEARYQFVHIPADSKYKYFDNMSINDDATFIYFNGYRYGWLNYRCDEMKALGNYDMMFTLPPVPRKGIYELRYKILATGARGIMQVYFGSDPANLPVAGIPIDIRLGLDSGRTGWEEDSKDDQDYNAEIDKRMRNNGYMHGIMGIQGDGHTAGERTDSRISRQILVRQEMDPEKTYYIRMKSVLDATSNEFYMDYMELCPKEVYDNPEDPEDIW